MSDYDLIIRGGTVMTAADNLRADVGIRAGRIAAVADRSEGGRKTIDAAGLLYVEAEIKRLFDFARTYGFDPVFGGIHDQVEPNGMPLLRTRRIWPVTEALKAFVAMAEMGETTPAEGNRLADHLLRSFLPTDRNGWHETLTREGVPATTDLPGSTPYHLFLAAIEAERLLSCATMSKYIPPIR